MPFHIRSEPAGTCLQPLSACPDWRTEGPSFGPCPRLTCGLGLMPSPFRSEPVGTCLQPRSACPDRRTEGQICCPCPRLTCVLALMPSPSRSEPAGTFSRLAEIDFESGEIRQSYGYHHTSRVASFLPSSSPESDHDQA